MIFAHTILFAFGIFAALQAVRLAVVAFNVRRRIRESTTNRRAA